MIRRIFVVGCCLMLAGCASHASQKSSTPAALQPYVETVPHSTVKFTMRPVSQTLWFAETETTWDAYDVFYLRLDEDSTGQAAGRDGPDAITRPTLPYSPPDRGWGHGGHPVIGITYHAATKYCEWLSEKTGRRYRLPTIGEFEDGLRQSRGTSLPEPLEMAWFADNADETTHLVAKKKPDLRGLYDMAGNVAEWCTDADGKPVVCGGSFNDSLAAITTESGANQLFIQKQTRDWNATDPSLPKSKWWLRDAPFVGFRVVCEETPR